MPALGCGNGGLLWRDVRREIENAFQGSVDVRVVVFEPSRAYRTAPKARGVEKLTPARVLIAELVRRYSILASGCTDLELQKLAWFLHRSTLACGLKDPTRLQFAANTYGPCSDQLRHLLDAMDGSHLHCELRLSEAAPDEPICSSRPSARAGTAYLESGEAAEYLPALEATGRLVDGFESPFGMELLATVDWLLCEQHSEPTVSAVRTALATWPGGADAGERKLRLFDERLFGIALGRLTDSPVAEPARPC